MTKDIKADNPLLVQVPMKKMGTPEDVPTCPVLASPDSDYITGETIRVDGGPGHLRRERIWRIA